MIAYFSIVKWFIFCSEGKILLFFNKVVKTKCWYQSFAGSSQMPTKMWPPDFSEIGLRVEFFSPAFDLNLTQSLKTEKQQLLQNDHKTFLLFSMELLNHNTTTFEKKILLMLWRQVCDFYALMLNIIFISITKLWTEIQLFIGQRRSLKTLS